MFLLFLDLGNGWVHPVCGNAGKCACVVYALLCMYVKLQISREKKNEAALNTLIWAISTI